MHPGEILVEEFLKPLASASTALPKAFTCHPAGSMKLSTGCGPLPPTPHSGWQMYFATTPSFWMDLQGRYDLEVEKDKLGRRLEREIASFAALAL